MPKPSRYPILLDNLFYVNITTLNKRGMLDTSSTELLKIPLEHRYKRVDTIWAEVDKEDECTYIILYYKSGQGLDECRVELRTRPSNIGKGLLWFFICPYTGQLCRKLYFIDGQFCCFSAVEGAIYASQSESKWYRMMDKTFGDHLRIEELYEQMHKKYLKRTYAGEPTKKYLKLTERIKRAEGVCLEPLLAGLNGN